jgi:hypothetical protein
LSFLGGFDGKATIGLAENIDNLSHQYGIVVPVIGLTAIAFVVIFGVSMVRQRRV